MDHKRTVFILGAGASIQYGFPSGAKLIDEICQQLPAAARGGGELLPYLPMLFLIKISSSRFEMRCTTLTQLL